METKEQALELIINTIPYPAQITDWDFTSSEGGIYFTWRKTNRFRFDFKNIDVEEVGDGVLMGSDIAILLRTLFQRALNK